MEKPAKKAPTFRLEKAPITRGVYVIMETGSADIAVGRVTKIHGIQLWVAHIVDGRSPTGLRIIGHGRLRRVAVAAVEQAALEGRRK